MKVAIVATIPAIKTLTELYEAANIESPWETRVFDSIADARAWVSPVHEEA